MLADYVKLSRFATGLVLLLMMMTCATRAAEAPTTRPTLTGRPPIVIGHRGACGYRPEHTLASYAVAIELGADFIEPDLVPTKDGILICRHENNIIETTDVADHPEFAARRVAREIDGAKATGWFTEDFTLAEIKTLRARERLPFRDHSFEGKFEIPTFREMIDLVQKRAKETGRVIGIYPETKHPTYFRSIGLPLEDRMLKTLHDVGWDGADAPVFIQSFEVANLKALRKQTPLRLIQLIGDADERPADLAAAGDRRRYADLITPRGLAEISAYANGIGPPKRLIIPAHSFDQGDKQQQPAGLAVNDSEMALDRPTTLIADAHKVGLLVHPYTFRSDRRYLARDYDADPLREYSQFYALGVDGVFSDVADVAVKARK